MPLTVIASTQPSRSSLFAAIEDEDARRTSERAWIFPRFRELLPCSRTSKSQHPRAYAALFETSALLTLCPTLPTHHIEIRDGRRIEAPALGPII